MANKTGIQVNKTGAAASPRHTKALHEASAKIKRPSTHGKTMVEVRRSYANGGSIGSVPTPTSFRGLGKALVEMLKGERAPALMDRLSERLCSERSAVRLYEGLISKYDTMGSWSGGPTRDDLERLRSEEMVSYHHLHRQIEKLGADPTALTPAADVTGVAMAGFPQVIADPRTNLRQCIEVMLVAELADNAYWESLYALVVRMGREELASGFHFLLAREAGHLALMRSWVSSGQSTSAGLHPTFEKPTARSKGNGRRKRTTKSGAKRQPRAR